MAKRRIAKKKTTRRRSRVGAIPGGITDVLSVVAGAAVAKIAASKIAPTMDAKIKNAALIVIGAVVLPKVLKNAMGKNIGLGMATAGGLGLLSDFNVISGIDTYQLPVVVSGLPGSSQLPVMSGNTNDGQMSRMMVAGAAEEEGMY